MSFEERVCNLIEKWLSEGIDYEDGDCLWYWFSGEIENIIDIIELYFSENIYIIKNPRRILSFVEDWDKAYDKTWHVYILKDREVKKYIKEYEGIPIYKLSKDILQILKEGIIGEITFTNQEPNFEESIFEGEKLWLEGECFIVNS